MNNHILIYLALLSVVTSLVMEGVKKFKSDFTDNAIVAIISFLVTAIGFVFYVLYKNIAITPLLIVEGLVMAIFVWLCSTLGYDKVIETIKQRLGGIDMTPNGADKVYDKEDSVYKDEPDENPKDRDHKEVDPKE